MRVLLLIGLFLISDLARSQEIDAKHLKCLVCRAVMHEVDLEVSKTNPDKLVNVGSYRMDALGNTIHKQIPLSHSEVYISDILDTTCHKMSNYVRATKKSNNKLTVVSMLSDSGDMNPRLGRVNIIQDGDLNRSLEYYCGIIMEEFEDKIISLYIDNVEDKKEVLCTMISGICNDYIDDDDEDNYDKQAEFEQLAQDLLRDDL